MVIFTIMLVHVKIEGEHSVQSLYCTIYSVIQLASPMTYSDTYGLMQIKSTNTHLFTQDLHAGAMQSYLLHRYLLCIYVDILFGGNLAYLQTL